MPTNDFKPFAVSGGAAVVSQATYAAATALLATGFQTGIADPTYLNKVWRQSSIMAAVLAQMVSDQTGLDALDDGTTATLLANLTTAIKNLSTAVATSNSAIATTGGPTTLSAAQAKASFIIVTGALTSNATLVFPTANGTWSVINNTTGGFSLTCKTSAGTGVTVRQGSSDTVLCDGVNVVYAQADMITQATGDNSTAGATTAFVQQALSAVGGYYTDTGIANAYVIATIPATTSYTTGMSFRIRISHINTGASTLDAGGGAKPFVRQDTTPLHAGDAQGIVTVTYDSTVGGGSWLFNGAAASDLGTLAKMNIGGGLVDDGAGNLTVVGEEYKFGAFNVRSGAAYLVDTSAAAVTATLPAAPTVGFNATFTDVRGTWAANNFTLARNGKNIMGLAQDLAANISDVEFTIWYNGTEWRLI